MDLTPDVLTALVDLRHDLHRHPEVSGAEAETARRVRRALAALAPDQIVTGLGGHGLAAVFNGAASGPTVMLRAELDALPIPEAPGPAHVSQVPGVAHLCGHDGHAVILIGVAHLLSQRRPAKGRAVLMFQPAEEDGSGAAAVLADPAFAALRPDWAFALHNMPGLPLGQARVSAGPANCASVGLRLQLQGRTAHAATPDTGLSPQAALFALIPALSALGPGGALGPDFRLVTVTHARLGTPTFGIAPGEAELWVTLRSLGDAPMRELKARACALSEEMALRHGLSLRLSWHDDFAACHNDPQAVTQIEAALAQAGVPYTPAEGPMRASEDFGRFAQTGARSAMFLLGAGEESPALHDPAYDFPEALIAPGVSVFAALLQKLLG
ncbi:amidohydrolase [Pseudorhodobacter sp. MZDSW-24AT]|uniref:amidohydrolase n=1 Tax=Pseudorhodobacter sp. MZDSW-24AT TaxID=2052957 RepID=UPI000C1F6E46|nr:amidohydrolase [Pseudorhodobacter sp. MZDSW-24AT]PJF10440.1 amidohydrolase [Pseudorhodobacter sp. MZDSW-24AT]